MQSLMGETPKTALHRYSLFPKTQDSVPHPIENRYSCLQFSIFKEK
ncbi:MULTISPECIES: hypothetical protein [unclassified Moorena]|nr:MULTISPECIES: hypothetical protein [unclassified Moorena]NEO10944.1 hypothetical protein [Moorena sp. SIO3E8]NEP99058.1 hypothetical protein [Moorena sp. SIO3F7]